MAHAVIDDVVFQNLKEMVGEDFIGELIDTFLDESPKLITDLQRSLTKKDIETFRRCAHSLKSNSASFGAQTLAVQAKELEALAREKKLDAVGDKVTTLTSEYEKVEQVLKKLRHDFE